MFRVGLAAAAALFARLSSVPAQDESLGLKWGEASAGTAAGAASGELAGGWFFGAAQGIDLGISAVDLPGGLLGAFEAHLFLMPQDDRKYGFYARLTDADGRKASLLTAGVEGMMAPTDAVTIEARAGAGWFSNGWDLVSAEARGTYAPSDMLAFTTGLSLTEIDEAALRAVLYRADLGVSWFPADSPLEIRAALVRDGLAGHDARPGETRLEASPIWHFGASAGARRGVSERGHQMSDPMQTLARYGLF